MKNNKYTIFNALEYDQWLEGQSDRNKVQIRDRISRIRESGHFGVHKDLEDDVWELKWKNGRRVYYAYIPEEKILLLLGGNKNGQDKDIKEAKKIFNKYVTVKKSADFKAQKRR